jgi:hypothetical protein
VRSRGAHGPKVLNADKYTALMERSRTASLVGMLGIAALFATLAAAKSLDDPDFFWHVKAGELIVTTASLPSVDPFSFTWAGRQWIPHEWLGEAILFLVDRAGGWTALQLVWSFLAGTLVATIGVTLVRRRVSAGSAIAALVVGGLVILPYVTLRPQIFSWLFIAVLIAILLALTPTRRWLLFAIPVLFVVWVNVHGLWTAGIGILGIYVVAALLGRTPMSRSRGALLASTAAALVALIVTPNGLDGLLYPLRYVEGGDWGLENISEWQSPNFHDVLHWPLLAMLLALALTGSGWNPGWLRIATWLGVAGALYAFRLAPVAGVLGTISIGLALDDLTGSRQRLTPPRFVNARRMAIVGALLIGALVGWASYATRPHVLNADIYPIQAVEQLQRTRPDARVFAHYGWGGYVIWALHDAGGRVFVDGRNDMYSQQILEDYSRIAAAEGDWRGLLDSYEVSAIIVPPDSYLAAALRSDPTWCSADRSPTAVLLTRGRCSSST